jgi:hypothetical protein
MRLLVCLLTALPLFAQTTASLHGKVVVDGLPVRGVTVRFDPDSGLGERTTLTDETGAYLLAALPPGPARLRFELEGLKDREVFVRLAVGQLTRVGEVSMRPLHVISELDVYAPQIAPITNNEIASTLTLDEIEELPVQRNQLATAQLAPGVNANTLANGVLQIAGGPSYDNLVLVNGVVVTENRRGQMRPMYVEDAIVETAVLTGSISAEYGRFSGGVVNTITKSGGEAYSGSLRDSLSNPRWSSTTPASEAHEDNLNHVFEATLGGRLISDRLWFFTSGRWAKNDTARQTVAVPGSASQLSYTESNDQKRYEAKLTSRLTDAQGLIASWFGIDTQTENSRFNNNIYDAASLTSRDEPESLFALRYGGQLVNTLTMEAQLSRRTMSLSSGAFTRDLIGGTLLLDRANSNARFGAPSLCDVCEDERRDNEDLLVKAHWFVRALGGHHDLVGGIDRFRERHFLEDHQSGSGFAVFVTRAEFRDGAIHPVITPTTQNGGGTFIRWMPILTAPRETDLRTDSVFLNDRFFFSEHWSFSLGARYDRNHAVDSDGTTTADDRRLSPRLGAQYDVFGSGHLIFSASYGEYASRIAGSIANLGQEAGAAAAIDFAYRGPQISGVPVDDALQRLFNHFNTQQGGTANTSANNLRPNGSRDVPGYGAYFDGTLASPYVRELTIGAGMLLGGAKHYVRLDLVSRDWNDFYAANVTPSTLHETTPLGITVDRPLIRNTNDVERTWRAAMLQARMDRERWNLGVHYTLSTLRGNDEGDSANGAVANLDPSRYYPEFLDYERNNPVGYLQGDQRHRVRAWYSYSWPHFTASVLQTFDSGLAYSITAPINVTRYTGAPSNPGYAAIPNGRYFLTDRGALRTDDVTSTSLALRFDYNFFFAQADVLNLFDEDALADPQRLGSSVSTAANAQDLAPFDPRTTTPVEGVHYRLAANFGQPLNNMAYQTPRTFRVSFGARF